MTFRDCLNHYIEILGCSARELSEISSVSAAVISRYRSGEREPGTDSAQLSALAKGIARLSQQKLPVPFAEEEVYILMLQSITGIRVDYDTFLTNLRTLLEALSIGNNEIARALRLDPSYISRIMNGKRRPADLPDFISMISAYIARFYRQGNDVRIIADLTDCNQEEAADEAECAGIIANWLGTSSEVRVNNVSEFLQKLDEFDMNAFREKFENTPVLTKEEFDALPVHGAYSGVQGMRKAEIDFTMLVNSGGSPEKVITYSDWPLDEIKADPEYLKTWENTIMTSLVKGYEFHVIYDVHRPFRELMDTITNWIPLFMTGHILLYYLKMQQGDPFLRIIRCSPSVILIGTSIRGHEADGRVYLSRKPEDISHYYQEAEWLLRRAMPLMDIFRDNRAEEYLDFYSRVIAMPGKRSIEMCTLPIFTISDRLLASILKRLAVPEADKDRIFWYVHFMRWLLDETLDRSMFQINIPRPDENAFRRGAYNLSLSGMFYPRALPYTYEEYKEHLRLTDEYARDKRGLILTGTASPRYRNINVTFHEGKYAVISKNDQPTVHFALEHPNMLEAFEHLS